MKVLLAILVLVLLPSKSYCQIHDTIIVDFERTTGNKTNTETVKGTIYTDGITQTLVISEPINQWMILEKNDLLLYYPDTRKAIKLNSTMSTPLGFFQAFLNAAKKDYGLSELGYLMDKIDTVGDTLITRWNPPEDTVSDIGEFIVAYTDDRISYTKTINKKGRMIAHTVFDNYYMHGTSYYPLLITSYMDISNTANSFEEIVFSNLSFSQPLPSDIQHFVLPDDVTIEERKW